MCIHSVDRVRVLIDGLECQCRPQTNSRPTFAGCFFFSTTVTLGQGGQWPEGEGYERPHVLVTSPGSPERPRPAPALAPSVGGRIQVRLSFEPSTLQLLVTIVCAAGLTPRSPHQPRNPYCKLFLLPDRSEKSKRRTRTLAGIFVDSELVRSDF